MNRNRLFTIAVLMMVTLLRPLTMRAEIITANKFSTEQVPNLQSLTTQTIILDKDGFIWISNSNGIDRYDGKNTYHYKLGDLGKRGYRDGMMNLMHRDHDGKIWAFTERGVVYCYDEEIDEFRTIVDLYKLEKYVSVQAAFSIDESQLILGTNEGIICYSIDEKKVLAQVANDCNVRCFTQFGEDRLLVGSYNGMFVYDINEKKVEMPLLNKLPVICLEPVGENIWIGTQGKGLYYMPKGNPKEMKLAEGTLDLIINSMAFAENYGLLLGTDGKGLMQLDLNPENGTPTSDLTRIANDSKDAIFPILSAGINDVMVHRGNVWFSMQMGGCMRLIPNHNFVTLTNPTAESSSDNFVFDLDSDADGNLWAAFNQTLVRFDEEGKNPQCFMDHESRFLSIKVRPDGTVWAGGFGTGLYHFNPETEEKEWYSSVCGASVNDNIYDIHDSPDGDLWIGGLNLPLTRLHFNEDGSFEKTHYNEMTQVYDIESLNKDTLVTGTSDGIWLLNIKTGEVSHHFQVGEEHEWQGTNLVRCISIRNNREVWIATAGAGLVCYDVPTNHYDYYDNLNLLPSLELRSILILNDSLICVSTEDKGIFSFNCNSRFTERAMLQEDAMLRQEFLQNSGIRMANGNLLFGGMRGGIVLTPRSIAEERTYYSLFITGPKVQNKTYTIDYRHNNLAINVCTNDIYHQHDYKYQYRIEGWSDNWLPFNDGGSLHLVNLPSGSWELEIRATNSTGMEMLETLFIEVNRPIWKRWYAWGFYVFFFLYTVLKIVLYLLRPRIEDM